MNGKRDEARFTIQFSRTDPSHRQVSEILNRQGRRGKALFIVSAVLHYINCGDSPGTRSFSRPDEKPSGTVATRIHKGKEGGGTAPSCEEIEYANSVEALDSGGLSAIADTLEIFRKKGS